MTELKEWTFDQEEENQANCVDRYFDEENRGNGPEGDPVFRTELDHGVDHQFVTEVNAVSNAGEKGGARDFDLAKGQTRAHTADEQRGHAQRNHRTLPDAHHDAELVLAQL